jgi:6-phosphogluconolactonase
MSANPQVPAARSTGDIRVFADGKAFALGAAEMFVQSAADAVAARGRFCAALAGGSTPKRLYELLAKPEWAGRVKWSALEIFWGDERYVPADDPLSNYRMTNEALLKHVPVPSAQVHRVPTEIAPATKVAEAYEQTITRVFGSASIPHFDFVLLGLGTNGHTASLFPHSPMLHDQRLVVADYVNEVNMWRITMTARLINAARLIAFLVTGPDKSDVLHDVLYGPRDPERLPAQLITPEQGRLVWLVDKAAAARLPQT